MRSTVALLLAVSLAGANSGCSTGFADVPPSPKKAAKTVSVSITAATMADDCGPDVDTAPMPEPKAPTSPAKSEAPAPVRDSPAAKAAPGPAGEGAEIAAESRTPSRCQQSSMQLSIVAPAGLGNTEIRVKKIQIFDEDGTLIGDLTPRSPSVWSKDEYKAWNQKIKGGQTLAVSYALSKPSWGGVLDRYSKSYTVKVVVSTGGSDLSLDHDVTMYTEASLPPGVVT